MTREKFNRMNEALIHWDEMIGDIRRLADEYEESGWRTLVLHPGDVSATTSESDDQTTSFRLVVPESELDALAELVNDDGGAYDEFEVHRAPEGDLLLLVVIVKSPEQRGAVFFPVYYDPEIDQAFVEELRRGNTIRTEITNLNQTRRFAFDHDKPTLFLP